MSEKLADHPFDSCAGCGFQCHKCLGARPASEHPPVLDGKRGGKTLADLEEEAADPNKPCSDGWAGCKCDGPPAWQAESEAAAGVGGFRLQELAEASEWLASQGWSKYHIDNQQALIASLATLLANIRASAREQGMRETMHNPASVWLSAMLATAREQGRQAGAEEMREACALYLENNVAHISVLHAQFQLAKALRALPIPPPKEER